MRFQNNDDPIFDYQNENLGVYFQTKFINSAQPLVSSSVGPRTDCDHIPAGMPYSRKSTIIWYKVPKSG